MDTVFKFLRDCKTFYLATQDGDQPRVRPLGAVCIFEGRLYICTNNRKPMSKQMKANPKVEISAADASGRWLRLSARAAADDRREARQAMLDAVPSLQGLYKADDGIYEVFYLSDAVGVISSFSGERDEHRF